MICACTETSSAETSSSAIRHSGSTAKRAGDADALALAAAEFVRIALGRIGRQAHQLEQLADALRRPRRRWRRPWNADRLGQRLPHRHARVERAVGILEDHLHAAVDSRAALPREASARPVPS